MIAFPFSWCLDLECWWKKSGKLTSWGTGSLSHLFLKVLYIPGAFFSGFLNHQQHVVMMIWEHFTWIMFGHLENNATSMTLLWLSICSLRDSGIPRVRKQVSLAECLFSRASRNAKATSIQGLSYPISSMYGIYKYIHTYIWLIFMANVGKYTIQGWYGIWHQPKQYTTSTKRKSPKYRIGEIQPKPQTSCTFKNTGKSLKIIPDMFHCFSPLISEI